jgi:hypothetical protein
VHKAIKEKKECFRRMHMDRSVDNVERYKMVKKTAKQPVSEARSRMYDGLYQRLGTKEGDKDIYRMAKKRERKTRDIIQVKCIKDETERLLTKDEDIKNWWREYFDKLFNKDSESSSIELHISLDGLNRQFVRRIQESEVKCALKRMKGGKAFFRFCFLLPFVSPLLFRSCFISVFFGSCGFISSLPQLAWD